MAFPISVTFRGMAHSDPVEAHIRHKAERLSRWATGIVSCIVTVDVPHRHHLHGNRYRVRILVTLPGETVVVGHRAGHEADADRAYQDLHAAIETAFDDAGRMMVEVGDRRRARMHARAQEEERREARVRQAVS